jgi:hypothetical protein
VIEDPALFKPLHSPELHNVTNTASFALQFVKDYRDKHERPLPPAQYHL